MALAASSTMDWVNARSFVALGATMATFNVVVPPPDGLPPPLGVPPPPPPLLLHAAATIARTATTAARRAHRNVRLFIPTSPRPGLAPDLRRSLCLPSHPPRWYGLASAAGCRKRRATTTSATTVM